MNKRVCLLVVAVVGVAGCVKHRESLGQGTGEVAAVLAGAHASSGSVGGDSKLDAALSAIAGAHEISADNLANAKTIAFKRRQALFLEAGKYRTQINMEQGPTEITNRALDVSIQGPGFLRVKVLDNIGDGTAYTRNGNLFINQDGNLVLGLAEGYRLQPPITFPQGITEKDISISEVGVVSYKLATSNTSQTAGQLQLVNFINPEGLNVRGESLYSETEASGRPTIGEPGDNGTGILRQGSLEGSNVDEQRELLALKRLAEWRARLLEVLYGRP